MPGGHRYVRPVSTTRGPLRVVVAVPSYVPVPGPPRSRTRRLAGDRVWLAYSRRRGERWSAPELADAVPVGEVWDWIDAHTHAKAQTWVVSYNCGDFLTAARFWDETERGRYQVWTPGVKGCHPDGSAAPEKRAWVGAHVLSGVPDILTARRGPARLTFVGLRNYASSPLTDLAKWAEIDLPAGEPAPDRSGPGQLGPELTRRICLATFTRLVSEWVAGDMGPWRHTAAQLVLSLWKRRFYSVPVCRHTHAETAALEAQALHGGRASVWWWGDAGTPQLFPTWEAPAPRPSRYGALPGPVDRWDVTSMYPTILRDELFPVRQIRYYPTLSVDRLAALCDHRGVIAEVVARVGCPEYPMKAPHRITYRWEGARGGPARRRVEMAPRVIYPVGPVTLTLAAPELRRLIAEGAVREVRGVAVYDLGRPFRGLMGYLLREREAAKLRGDAFLSTLMKTWANAFGGKFAQQSVKWLPRPEVVPPIRWGQWTDIDGDSGAVSTWRALAGLAHVREVGQHGAKLLAAVYAYLTSYGRCRMRELREALPRGTVLSQDTDGLWTVGAATTVLTKATTQAPPGPGSLRHVGQVESARWFTPKHYWTDGRWTLAGVADGFTVEDRDHVRAVVRTNPIRGVPTGPPSILSELVQTVRLDLIGPSEFIGPDGWTVPPAVVCGRVVTADRVT